jgi:hypothetical protein
MDYPRGRAGWRFWNPRLAAPGCDHRGFMPVIKQMPWMKPSQKFPFKHANANIIATGKAASARRASVS